MRIAANTRFMIPGYLTGFGHYSYEILVRMVRSHPCDDFQFYFDRKYPEDYLFGDNVTGYTLFPPARHPLLFYLWYQQILRRALHKNKPDVFFSPGSFMPLNLDCPSVITVHDVAHQRYPEGVSYAHRKYYDYFLPKFIEEASRILTVSHFSEQEILTFYPHAQGKIEVIYNGVNDTFVPLEKVRQEQVCERYTDGVPYILFVGMIHPRKNVAGLIRAYSRFREIQDNRFKLLIVGPKSWKYTDVDQALRQSAYAGDIIFTGYLDVSELPGVTAGASAMCFIPFYEGFGLPVAEAMKCGVPVVVTSSSAQAEVAGEAGICVDPNSTQEIAEALVSVTSDDALRQELIVRGLERSALFSWDIASEATYDILSEAAR